MTKSFKNYFNVMNLDVEDLLKICENFKFYIKKIEIQSRNKNNTMSVKDKIKIFINFEYILFLRFSFFIL